MIVRKDLLFVPANPAVPVQQRVAIAATRQIVQETMLSITNVQEGMITNAASPSLTKRHSVQKKEDSVLTGWMISFDNDHHLIFQM